MIQQRRRVVLLCGAAVVQCVDRTCLRMSSRTSQKVCRHRRTLRRGPAAHSGTSMSRRPSWRRSSRSSCSQNRMKWMCVTAASGDTCVHRRRSWRNLQHNCPRTMLSSLRSAPCEGSDGTHASLHMCCKRLRGCFLATCSLHLFGAPPPPQEPSGFVAPASRTCTCHTPLPR